MNKIDKELYGLVKEFCLICPNCDRKIPNPEFRRKHGCKWCVQENE